MTSFNLINLLLFYKLNDFLSLGIPINININIYEQELGSLYDYIAQNIIISDLTATRPSVYFQKNYNSIIYIDNFNELYQEQAQCVEVNKIMSKNNIFLEVFNKFLTLFYSEKKKDSEFFINSLNYKNIRNVRTTLTHFLKKKEIIYLENPFFLKEGGTHLERMSQLYTAEFNFKKILNFLGTDLNYLYILNVPINYVNSSFCSNGYLKKNTKLDNFLTNIMFDNLKMAYDQKKKKPIYLLQKNSLKSYPLIYNHKFLNKYDYLNSFNKKGDINMDFMNISLYKKILLDSYNMDTIELRTFSSTMTRDYADLARHSYYMLETKKFYQFRRYLDHESVDEKPVPGEEIINIGETFFQNLQNMSTFFDIQHYLRRHSKNSIYGLHFFTDIDMFFKSFDSFFLKGTNMTHQQNNVFLLNKFSLEKGSALLHSDIRNPNPATLVKMDSKVYIPSKFGYEMTNFQRVLNLLFINSEKLKPNKTMLDYMRNLLFGFIEDNTKSFFFNNLVESYNNQFFVTKFLLYRINNLKYNNLLKSDYFYKDDMYYEALFFLYKWFFFRDKISFFHLKDRDSLYFSLRRIVPFRLTKDYFNGFGEPESQFTSFPVYKMNNPFDFYFKIVPLSRYLKSNFYMKTNKFFFIKYKICPDFLLYNIKISQNFTKRYDFISFLPKTIFNYPIKNNKYKNSFIEQNGPILVKFKDFNYYTQTQKMEQTSYNIIPDKFNKSFNFLSDDYLDKYPTLDWNNQQFLKILNRKLLFKHLLFFGNLEDKRIMNYLYDYCYEIYFNEKLKNIIFTKNIFKYKKFNELQDYLLYKYTKFQKYNKINDFKNTFKLKLFINDQKIYKSLVTSLVDNITFTNHLCRKYKLTSEISVTYPVIWFYRFYKMYDLFINYNLKIASFFYYGFEFDQYTKKPKNNLYFLSKFFNYVNAYTIKLESSTNIKNSNLVKKKEFLFYKLYNNKLYMEAGNYATDILAKVPNNSYYLYNRKRLDNEVFYHSDFVTKYFNKNINYFFKNNLISYLKGSTFQGATVESLYAEDPLYPRSVSNTNPFINTIRYNYPHNTLKNIKMHDSIFDFTRKPIVTQEFSKLIWVNARDQVIAVNINIISKAYKMTHNTFFMTFKEDYTAKDIEEMVWYNYEEPGFHLANIYTKAFDYFADFKQPQRRRKHFDFFEKIWEEYDRETIDDQKNDTLAVMPFGFNIYNYHSYFQNDRYSFESRNPLILMQFFNHQNSEDYLRNLVNFNKEISLNNTFVSKEQDRINFLKHNYYNKNKELLYEESNWRHLKHQFNVKKSALFFYYNKNVKDPVYKSMSSFENLHNKYEDNINYLYMPNKIWYINFSSKAPNNLIVNDSFIRMRQRFQLSDISRIYSSKSRYYYYSQFLIKYSGTFIDYLIKPSLFRKPKDGLFFKDFIFKQYPQFFYKKRKLYILELGNLLGNVNFNNLAFKKYDMSLRILTGNYTLLFKDGYGLSYPLYTDPRGFFKLSRPNSYYDMPYEKRFRLPLPYRVFLGFTRSHDPYLYKDFLNFLNFCLNKNLYIELPYTFKNPAIWKPKRCYGKKSFQDFHIFTLQDTKVERNFFKFLIKNLAYFKTDSIYTGRWPNNRYSLANNKKYIFFTKIYDFKAFIDFNNKDKKNFFLLKNNNNIFKPYDLYIFRFKKVFISLNKIYYNIFDNVTNFNFIFDNFNKLKNVKELKYYSDYFLYNPLDKKKKMYSPSLFIQHSNFFEIFFNVKYYENLSLYNRNKLEAYSFFGFLIKNNLIFGLLEYNHIVKLSYHLNYTKFHINNNESHILNYNKVMNSIFVLKNKYLWFLIYFLKKKIDFIMHNDIYLLILRPFTYMEKHHFLRLPLLVSGEYDIFIKNFFILILYYFYIILISFYNWLCISGEGLLHFKDWVLLQHFEIDWDLLYRKYNLYPCDLYGRSRFEMIINKIYYILFSMGYLYIYIKIIILNLFKIIMILSRIIMNFNKFKMIILNLLKGDNNKEIFSKKNDITYKNFIASYLKDIQNNKKYMITMLFTDQHMHTLYQSHFKGKIRLPYFIDNDSLKRLNNLRIYSTFLPEIQIASRHLIKYRGPLAFSNKSFAIFVNSKIIEIGHMHFKGNARKILYIYQTAARLIYRPISSKAFFNYQIEKTKKLQEYSFMKNNWILHSHLKIFIFMPLSGNVNYVYIPIKIYDNIADFKILRNILNLPYSYIFLFCLLFDYAFNLTHYLLTEFLGNTHNVHVQRFPFN